MYAISGPRIGLGNPNLVATYINQLCMRSYWHRVWVVQEVNLAKSLTICCENKYLSGETFEAYFSNLYRGVYMAAQISDRSLPLRSVALECHISKRERVVQSEAKE
jgi:hypothetical protein